MEVFTQHKSPLKSPDRITIDSPTSKRQSVSRQSVSVKERTVNIDDFFSLTPTKDDNECPELTGTALPHKGTDTEQVLRYTEKDWLKMKQHMEFDCQKRVMSIGKEMFEKITQLKKKHYEEKMKLKK